MDFGSWYGWEGSNAVSKKVSLEGKGGLNRGGGGEASGEVDSLGSLTIDGVFLDDLHDSYDTGGLAVRVVEEYVISLHHCAHVASSCWG